MWRKGKRDKNELEIIHHLKENGVDCQSVTNQVLDLIVWTSNGGTSILEIKGEKTTFQRGQIKFMSTWPGNVGIAKTKEEALAFCHCPKDFGLTAVQKIALKQLLFMDKRESFPAKFTEEYLKKYE